MKKIFLFNLIVGAMAYGMNSPVLDLDGYTQAIGTVKQEGSLTADAKVIVPLEIITDLEVDATVVDDHKLEIPFTLVMNKNPNKEYKIKYTESIIDIDGDGKDDVEIISPSISNSKVEEKNKIVIDGAGIAKDGVYTKRIYMSVEVKDEGGE